jgi:hypothetical protein
MLNMVSTSSFYTRNMCLPRGKSKTSPSSLGTNWLYPPIVNAFREINRRTIETNGRGADAFLVDSKSNKRCGITQVRLYSIEVWSAETGDLVAGEVRNHNILLHWPA